MREAVIKVWCQVHWLDFDVRVEATVHEKLSLFDSKGPRDIDLCEDCAKKLGLFKLLDLLAQCPEVSAPPEKPGPKFAPPLADRTCRYPDCTSGDDGKPKVVLTLGGRNLHETRVHGAQYSDA